MTARAPGPAAAIALAGAGSKNAAVRSILLLFLLARPAGLFGRAP
jgi:branched-subunit amino acid ABC-type transport system permease component